MKNVILYATTLALLGTVYSLKPLNNILKTIEEQAMKRSNIEMNRKIEEESTLKFIYTSENEILDLVVPMSTINYNTQIFGNPEEGFELLRDAKVTELFIMEAKANGERIAKSYREGNVTEILKGANDVTADLYNENIYFATDKGIYTYKDNTVEKYGSLTDNFTSIVLLNTTRLFVVSENNLYEIVNKGNEKQIVNKVTNVKEIAANSGLYGSNNLYFKNNNDELFVYNENGIAKVTGVPDNVERLTFAKPSPFLGGDLVIIASTSEIGVLLQCNKNCVVVDTDEAYKQKVTSVAIGSMNVYYYVFNKKQIYEYNLFKMVEESIGK